MTSAQLIQQADDLKASVADTSSSSNEGWVARQALQDLYQKLLVMDLELALDKKVEQDLWNHAFKNQITVLQNQTKDKQNPKRSEIQASLNLFLETASGFYLQLLQELCSAFKLDLTFRRKSSHLGIFKEYGPITAKIRMPKLSSSMYICQHCLVHLGDIARYRQQIEQAQSYYRHAAHLVPYNGQPYNQLAILEAAKSDKLSTVFYYTRSLAVKHPFPVASTNLDKFYTKISRETLEYRGKLSMTETISTFLQFHAFVHLDSAPDKARKLGERLIASLPTHISSMSLTSYQLVQMMAINIFALYVARKKGAGKEDGNDGGDTGNVNRTHDIVLHLAVTMFEQLVSNTPKQEQKAKEYHTLPAIKVALDWLHSDSSLLNQEAFRNSLAWPHLAKLLNNLQFHGGVIRADSDTESLDQYVSYPLQEDGDLQCFLPMIKAHAHLDFSRVGSDVISGDLEVRFRCQQLVQHGKLIADQHTSLGLLAYTSLKTGRLQFNAPMGLVKAQTGPEGDSQPEPKHIRQNVAIQAILQKKQNINVLKGTAHNRQEPTINQQSNNNSQNQPQQSPPQYTPPTQQHHILQRPSLPQTIPSQPYPKQFNQYQPMAYQQPPPLQQGPRYMGLIGEGVSTSQQNPRIAQPRIPQQNQMGMAFNSNDTIGSHVGFVPHQLHSAALIPMGQMSSFNNQGNSMANIDRAVIGVHSQSSNKPFPQAPGAHRMAFEHQNEGSGIQRSMFSGHNTPPPHHPSITQSPSNPQSILASSQYGCSPGGYSHSQSYQPSSPYTNMGLGNPQNQSNNGYPNAFNPPMTTSDSTQSSTLYDLLSEANIDPDSPLSQAMLALASSGSGTLTSQGTSGPSSSYNSPMNKEDILAGMRYGDFGGMGRMSFGEDARQNLILSREDFNKDEPELKFADINYKSTGFSSSPGLNFSGLSINDQESFAPKPDSPETQPRSLFNQDTQDNTYSLFSRSPWTVSLPKSESDLSLSSSPFGSGEESVKSTPDTFGNLADTNVLTSGFPLGYSFGSSDGNWVNPPSPPPVEDNSSAKTLLSSSVQSLWSSGPSPLEKLLEQQKQLRHGDPL